MESKTDAADLTICSVFHNDQTIRFLELNAELTERLNSKHNWRWVVLDNSPEEFENVPDRNKFDVVPGATRFEMLESLPKKLHNKPIANSFHLTAALNKIPKYVGTRFVVILDNDFYIVRSEWVSEVIAHMKEHDLALFGSPWHPRMGYNFRYFPNHQSLFIDLEKVNLESLNWDPVYENPKWYRRFLEYIPKNLKKRALVGTEKDVSHLVYEKLHREVKYESVVPVLKDKKERGVIGKLLTKLERLLLPDRLLLKPKRRESFATENFKDLGYFDVESHFGEEFLWKRKPFGFHVRRFKFIKQSLSAKMEEEEKFLTLKKAIDSFQLL